MKIDSTAIGIEVSWSFGDGDAEAVTLPRDSVRDAVGANGFQAALVSDPISNTCLRKALLLVKGRSKTIVVQEMKRPNKDTPMSIGVYQVQGKDESGDNIVCGARARIQGNGRVEALAPEGVAEISECMTVASELARIANTLFTSMVNREISDLLTMIGWDIGWITRRRNSGGVYFIGAGMAAERFVGLLHDLQALTAHEHASRRFIPQIMEVYAKPLTMAMWSHSAVDQYDAQVAEMVAELKKVSAESTRDSTIEKRADDCDRLIARAESHRMFLAGHVDVLTAELRRVQGEFRKKLQEHREGAEEAFEEVARVEAPTPAPAAPVAPLAYTRPQHPKRIRRAAVTVKPMAELSTAELFDV